jgi:SAM-dependent methyltransferase
MIQSLKNIVRRSPAANRLARALVDRRYQLARRYVHGIGLEIGALNRPQTLPPAARAFYVDHFIPAELRQHYPELDQEPLYVSLIDDGEWLHSVRSDSLDFLIANHVLEHCEDPIRTVQTWISRLKPEGILMMAVPDRRQTFDHRRPGTTWDHLLQDHQRGSDGSRAAHYLEWAILVDQLSGPAADQRAQELMAMRYSIHFHCWTLPELLDFVTHLQDLAPVELLICRPWRNENILMLRRTAS